MEQRVDRIKDLSSQRERFTPSLFALLLQARKLEPMRDGRYLSFDVFSNTQVTTFEAKVTGCSAQKAISLEAEVNVVVGLRNRPSGTPRRLLYEMSKSSKGSWRINNITYLDGPGFQLRPYLKELLNPAS